MYEIWKKSDLGARTGVATRTHYTLDSSMISARELSKGSVKKDIYRYDSKDHWGTTSIEIPNVFAVIERGNRQSIIRGFGIGGVWYDARDCKRCHNTGNDSKSWEEPCYACKGASYKPKV